MHSEYISADQIWAGTSKTGLMIIFECFVMERIFMIWQAIADKIFLILENHFRILEIHFRTYEIHFLILKKWFSNDKYKFSDIRKWIRSSKTKLITRKWMLIHFYPMIVVGIVCNQFNLPRQLSYWYSGLHQRYDGIIKPHATDFLI